MVVLVDAENVRRSLWPNLSERRLVELLARWAEREAVAVVAVFDDEPAVDARAGVEVVAAGDESADDWIAQRGAELAAAGEPYRLVTSDRELRRRAGAAAAAIAGGGAFARELLTETDPP